jgi:hypothetical protein
LGLFDAPEGELPAQRIARKPVGRRTAEPLGLGRNPDEIFTLVEPVRSQDRRQFCRFAVGPPVKQHHRIVLSIGFAAQNFQKPLVVEIAGNSVGGDDRAARLGGNGPFAKNWHLRCPGKNLGLVGRLWINRVALPSLTEPQGRVEGHGQSVLQGPGRTVGKSGGGWGWSLGEGGHGEAKK